MEAIENLLQRYGTLTLVMAIITGLGGAFWWVSDQTHRIGVNENEIREIKGELSGRQDITPIMARLLLLEAKFIDVGPIAQRLATVETQQANLTTTMARMDEIQGRMAERLNIIDRRLAETSINVTANQELARKILDQQTAITGTIADIKRALPERPGGGFRLQSEESRPVELQPGQAGSQSGPPGR